MVPAGEGTRLVDAREDRRRKRVRLLRALKWLVVLVVVGYAVGAGEVALGLLGAGLVHVLLGVDVLQVEREVPDVVAAGIDREAARERYGVDVGSADSRARASAE